MTYMSVIRLVAACVLGVLRLSALDTRGSILCYKCDQMPSPDQCHRIIQCPDTQQCYVGQKYNGLSGTVVYESGCMDIQECHALPSLPSSGIVGKRQVPTCSSCCDHRNLCNNKCSETTTNLPSATTPSAATSGKPVIVYASSSGSIPIGSSVALFCKATGHPAPTMQWSVLTTVGNATLSIPVRENGNAQPHGVWTRMDVLHIDHFRPEYAGVYVCVAQNVAGSVRRSIRLSVYHNTPPTTTTTTMAPLSKPVITFLTNVHGVYLGSDVHLQCRATGHPTPIITWSILAASHDHDMPRNVHVTNHGADLSIYDVTQQNLGNYVCSAVNSQGSAFGVVQVQNAMGR